MASSEEKAYPSIPRTKEWSAAEDARSIPDESDSDSSSVAYTYYSVDSTNMTMSDLPGPGRLLGNLYSKLGKSLEYRIFKANAKRHGADPEEVGMRIRNMAIWKQGAEGNGSPFRQHALSLSEVKPSDAKLLRRCCRAILYYTSIGIYQTVISALRELIDLSIKYLAVRDAFNAVRAGDVLHMLPFLVQHPDTQELHVMESLVQKAESCLSDNLVYSACRKSFLLPSWSPELEGIELRLTLESFLSHRRLHSIATELIIFYQLGHKDSDPRKVFDLVQSLPFWSEYRHKRYSIGFQDLGEDERDILVRCCRNLLSYTMLAQALIKVVALEVVIDLCRRYRSVREVFVSLGAMKNLQHMSIEPDQPSEADKDKEVQDLAVKALSSIQDNEIYDLLKESTLRKSWTPEVEGVLLRLELEQYLSHPRLKTFASDHINFIDLSAYTFYDFEGYARYLLDPRWTEFGSDDNKELTLRRACTVLIKFAVGCRWIRTRADACKHIENLVFNRPMSRGIFNEVDLSEKLAKAVSDVQTVGFDSEIGDISRYSALAKRIILCLGDHEVFPKSIAYFKELDDTLLDIIFDYIRTPRLFFIGAKVLARTWLKVAFLYADMFSRIVTFVLEVLEDIAKYPDAEYLVVSVLERILFEETLGGPQNVSRYFGHSVTCGKFVDTLSRHQFRELYPSAYGTIQEYHEKIDCIFVTEVLESNL